MTWINSHKVFINSITILAFLGAVYFGFFLLTKVWILFIISGLISFFYVWKVPLFKGKNLRDIPGIKIYLIALVWVLICAFMPYLLDSNSDIYFILVLSFSLFFFMIAITIPFDIRDVKLDDSSKKTIPQLIGIQKSVFLSMVLLIISQLLLQSLLPSNLGIVIFTIIGIVLLYEAKKPNKELFYSAAIDGLLIMQVLQLYLYI